MLQLLFGEFFRSSIIEKIDFLNPTSKTTAFVALILLGGGISYPARGQASCVANFYIPVPPGALAVTDLAVTYTDTNCPSPDARLGASVRLRVGQTLNFWYRVQGDQAYLQTVNSQYPFVLDFRKYNGSNFLSWDLIETKALNRKLMKMEVQSTGGVFDWRMRAGSKQVFDVPGVYKIILTQNGADVTCAIPGQMPDCSPVIEVLP